MSDTRRRYRQRCGIAHGLDLVGERWALLVVRELLLGPKRFTDLAAGLPGIGTNVLTSRLKELQAGGIVEKETLPPPAASVVYRLTPYGQELEGVLLALARWGARSMGPGMPGDAVQAGWIAVALKACFRADRAGSLDETFELRLDGEVFHVRVSGARVDVRPGHAADAGLVIETDVVTLVSLLTALRKPHTLPPGSLHVTGPRRLLTRFLALFAFPEPLHEDRQVRRPGRAPTRPGPRSART